MVIGRFRLKVSSRYDWPAFKVTFESKGDLDFARRNKLTDDFTNRIKSYYNSDFDANMALYFTYEEK
ncbi:MAG: hypothetical protein ABI416_13285 [Ginsengibacter sp.]